MPIGEFSCRLKAKLAAYLLISLPLLFLGGMPSTSNADQADPDTIQQALLETQVRNSQKLPLLDGQDQRSKAKIATVEISLPTSVLSNLNNNEAGPNQIPSQVLSSYGENRLDIDVGINHLNRDNKAVAVVQILIVCLLFVVLVASTDQAIYQRIRNRFFVREKKISKMVNPTDIVNRYTCTYTLNKNLELIYASPALCELLEYLPEEIIGRPHALLIHQESAESSVVHFANRIYEANKWTGELVLKAKNGDKIYMETYIEAISNLRGEVCGYTAVQRNLTQKKRLEMLSVTDVLTNLNNRRKLEAQLNIECLRSGRAGVPFSLIIVDIDHFKRINDKHGHRVGDKVLIELSAMLAQQSRVTDTLGRWGGDEFMILCPYTRLRDARIYVEKLRHIIEGYGFPEVGKVTASFGVTDYVPGENVEDLLDRADKALYAAKKNGRNCTYAKNSFPIKKRLSNSLTTFSDQNPVPRKESIA